MADYFSEIVAAVGSGLVGMLFWMFKRHHRRIDRIETKVAEMPEKYATKVEMKERDHDIVEELRSIRNLLSDVLLKIAGK